MGLIDSFQNWFRGNRYFFYDKYNLGGSAKYQKVTDQQAITLGYLTNADFYSVASKVAEAAATLPYSLYRKNSDGERERITEGDLYNLIFMPNEQQTFGELIEEQVIYALTNGESYYYAPDTPIGFLPDQIISLPPELITKNLTDETSILSRVQSYTLNDTTPIIIAPEDMLHVLRVNPSVEGKRRKNGLSPLQAGWNKLNANNNNAIAESWYFENRGVSNLISGAGTAAAQGVHMTTEGKAQLDEALRGRLGGAHKANGTIVVKSAVDVQQLGASSSDMQMIEHDVQRLRDICNLISVPSELFNDPDNKTHANRREALKTFYTEAVIPAAQMQLRGYERKWIRQQSLRDGVEYVLEIDKEQIMSLQPSPMEERKQNREDVKAGIISAQEARVRNGEQRYEGDGAEEMDIPRVQTNTIPITDEGTEA